MFQSLVRERKHPGTSNLSSFPLVHGIKYTPLGISIVFNHEMIAHKLLEHPNIDVNKKTCESTALHYACLRNSVSLIEAISSKVQRKVNFSSCKVLFSLKSK